MIKGATRPKLSQGPSDGVFRNSNQLVLHCILWSNNLVSLNDMVLEFKHRDTSYYVIDIIIALVQIDQGRVQECDTQTN